MNLLPFVSVKEVDRAIFERLRKKVVAKGLYPDVATLTTADQLLTAKAAMRTAGKELIEVFGVGGWESKDEKGASKIVILHKGMTRGSLSGIGCFYYHQRLVNDVAVYDKYAYPDYSKNLRYEVRIICTTAAAERVLLDIVETALGGFTRMNPVLDNSTPDMGRSFMLRVGDGVNLTNSGIIEWMFQVEAEDVWLHSGNKVRENIAPMTKVTMNLVATTVVADPPVVGSGDSVITVEVE